ncbi:MULTISPECIES: MDR family oxidoreductase [unclassified Meiothermus]|uniref:acrylyl-CoA reductase (NADPH) n=1 Tax=unclassified Meiothermus TaxID=370471 RepID=UPI000D7C0D51|nr:MULTISPECIES: MDR family oxidoreductase [unclassified Meiothermus]PZA06244.1 oxidoreductase [Meiothermus sp. Pnk-1]RYM39518.1 oxidoreductase [Meiothermus sp. PNK-Is4]
MAKFKALILEAEGQPQIREIDEAELPAGDVRVRVEYSSLNFKDGLAITNQAKVIRSYPMVPGIDFAGTVVESASPEYQPGDRVLLTGWRVGEVHWGGMAQMARVKAEWLVPLPPGMSPLQAMGIGTAGFTAMLAVKALEEHRLSREREVLVSGAAGGVGSIAVALLAQQGYKVAASTGRKDAYEYLRALGATSIIERAELAAPAKPLESERWAGGVDTVGGEILAKVLAQTAYGGSVAACGNAGGPELKTTVFPFILRGVNLLGIESVMCPREKRLEAWRRLAQDLPMERLEAMIQVVPLGEVPRLAQEILKGQVRGRVVVDVNA